MACLFGALGLQCDGLRSTGIVYYRGLIGCLPGQREQQCRRQLYRARKAAYFDYGDNIAGIQSQGRSRRDPDGTGSRRMEGLFNRD